MRSPAPPCACGRPAKTHGLCLACDHRARRRARGLWVRGQVLPETLEALTCAAEVAGTPIEAQVSRALAEWASARATTTGNRAVRDAPAHSAIR